MTSHRRPSAVPGGTVWAVGAVVAALVLAAVLAVLAVLAPLPGTGAGAVGGEPRDGATDATGTPVAAVAETEVEAGAEAVAPAAGRSQARGGVAQTGSTGSTGSAGSAGSTSSARPGGRAGDGGALPVPVFRSMPLPQLLPRDAVGPLWLTPQDRAAGVLALDVPRAASGVLDVVPGAEPAPGGAGVRTVRVEVERGLSVDPVAFAATVMAALNDPRGWGARGDVSFARTDGAADLRVVLGSPDLVDALCAPLPTGGEVSCGRNGHAALNARRWVEATPEFADRTQYRQYLVNHEVGHLLGHQHERCPGTGRLAPLMQQQSLRVAPCLPNGWPYPTG